MARGNLRRDEKPTERVAVIGLGRFGTSLARTLAGLGYEVTAIDRSDKLVAEIADDVTLAAQGDGTDEVLLRSLAVDKCRYGVVTTGENLESSVLGTLVLKRVGVPWVVAKATGPLHAELLRRIGADRVVSPEIEAGIDLAHTISIRHVSDYIALTAHTGAAKLTAPAHCVGRALGELLAPHAGQLDVLLIQRGDTLLTHPGPQEQVQDGDELLVVGADPAIDAFVHPADSR